MPLNKWAVVGGGTLGLALAEKLASRGQSVHLFEAAAAIGGLTAGHRYGELQWDNFYHVIAREDNALLALIETLGIAEDVTWTGSKTDFYDGKKLSPLNNVIDYLKLPALGMLDKARLAVNILHASRISDGQQLESLSAKEWLSRWSGSSTYENLWRPLLKSKLGANVDHASAAYIWTIIKRFYGAREGVKRKEQFGYLASGYELFLEAMLKRLGTLNVEIRCNTSVDRIITHNGSLNVQAGNTIEAFDKIIFSGPNAIASAICPDLSAAEHELLRTTKYQGVVCSSVLCKKPANGAYMTYITDDTVPFTTVIEMSALTGTKRFDGHHLIYLPRYVPSDDKLLSASNEHIEDLFLRGLFSIYPHINISDIVTTKTSRASHVLAVPVLNHSSKLPPIKTSIAGFYVCNSSQIVNAALSVNESVEHADFCLNTLLH